jgi:hypothetical protein
MSMEKKKTIESRFRRNVELCANLAIFLMVIGYAVVFAKNYFSKPKQLNPIGSEFVKGERVKDIPGVDFSTYSNTVLLALNTGCTYCTQSVAFYKQLAESVSKNNGSCQIIAVFPNKTDKVSEYVKEHQLPIKYVGKVDYDALKVKVTPSLILADNKGKIKEYWTGKLSEDREKEVFDSISKLNTQKNIPERREDITKTIDIFEESQPLFDIQEESSNESKPAGIGVLGFDDSNNLYVGGRNYFAKYDARGRLLKKANVSSDAQKGPACIDGQGNVYTIANQSRIVVYGSSLEGKIREIEIPKFSPPIHEVLKMSVSPSTGRIYLHTLTKTPLSQSLYSLDADGSNERLVHKVENPVMFHPFYTPGAFNFAAGDKYLYVSDPYDYTIHLYSVTDDSLVRTFTKPFKKQQLYKVDGKMRNKEMEIEDITMGGKWQYYPPIASLDFAPSGKLLVWMYNRDRGFKQEVHIYDSELNYIGIDLKFNNPTYSRYFFTKDRAAVDDFGFGKEFHLSQLSPLDYIARPKGIKTFRVSFSPLAPAAAD